MTFGDEIEAVRKFIGLTDFRVNIVLGLHVEFTGGITGGCGFAVWEWRTWDHSPFSLRDKLTWAALTIKAASFTDKAERELVLDQAARAAAQQETDLGGPAKC